MGAATCDCRNSNGNDWAAAADSCVQRNRTRCQPASLPATCYSVSPATAWLTLHCDDYGRLLSAWRRDRDGDSGPKQPKPAQAALPCHLMMVLSCTLPYYYALCAFASIHHPSSSTITPTLRLEPLDHPGLFPLNHDSKIPTHPRACTLRSGQPVVCFAPCPSALATAPPTRTRSTYVFRLLRLHPPSLQAWKHHRRPLRPLHPLELGHLQLAVVRRAHSAEIGPKHDLRGAFGDPISPLDNGHAQVRSRTSQRRLAARRPLLCCRRLCQLWK